MRVNAHKNAESWWDNYLINVAAEEQMFCFWDADVTQSLDIISLS